MAHYPTDKIIRKPDTRTIRYDVTLPMNVSTDVTVPFSPAFEDTNYTVIRDFQAAGNLAVGGIEMQRIISRQTNSVTVRMRNSSLENAPITLHVIIIHD